MPVRHIRADGKYASRVSEAIRELGRDARNLALVPEAEMLLYVARDVQLIEAGGAARVATTGTSSSPIASSTRREVLGRHGRHLSGAYTDPILARGGRWTGPGPGRAVRRRSGAGARAAAGRQAGRRRSPPAGAQRTGGGRLAAPAPARLPGAGRRGARALGGRGQRPAARRRDRGGDRPDRRRAGRRCPAGARAPPARRRRAPPHGRGAHSR